MVPRWMAVYVIYFHEVLSLTASCGFINVLPFFADQVILGVAFGAFLGTFTTFFPFTLL